jgi:hypothetical protein
VADVVVREEGGDQVSLEVVDRLVRLRPQPIEDDSQRGEQVADWSQGGGVRQQLRTDLRQVFSRENESQTFLQQTIEGLVDRLVVVVVVVVVVETRYQIDDLQELVVRREILLVEDQLLQVV